MIRAMTLEAFIGPTSDSKPGYASNSRWLFPRLGCLLGWIARIRVWFADVHPLILTGRPCIRQCRRVLFKGHCTVASRGRATLVAGTFGHSLETSCQSG